MVEERPCVALLCSPGVDRWAEARGFTAGFAQLLAPFTTHQINIKDPSTGTTASSKVSLDVRDLRRQGFLLSLTVLPSVLHEALCYSTRTNGGLEPAVKTFSDALAHWAEPVDQETFRTYLSCVFVVACAEQNPMGELSQLIQNQHTQQHGSSDSILAPSHCAPPKWTSPNTLKHFVLVHDAATDDEARSVELFGQMCATYGAELCQLLKMGVGEATGLPDAWRVEADREKILQRGLTRARERVMAKGISTAAGVAGTMSTSSSISTISPSYAMPPALPPSPLTPSSEGPSTAESTPTSEPERERLASSHDREALARMCEHFIKSCLVPYVERMMRTLYDQLAQRRGISRSLTSGMKKWFGSAPPQHGQTPVSYSGESAEMQSRRLADLSFLFGLHALAHSQYQTVKKEFAADHAALHHACALEMSAVSLHLSQTTLAAKQFPSHYLENALGYLIGNAARWTQVLRGALSASHVLSSMSQYVEAAAQLVRLTSMENDECVGAVLAAASHCFEQAGMERKCSFYRVLAGHRFVKSDLRALSLEAYRQALPSYYEKRWEFAEDHIAYVLSGESSDGDVAIGCARRLVRESERQTPEQQTEYLKQYARVLSRFPRDACRHAVAVPVLDAQSTRVICGERPLAEDVHSAAGGAGGANGEEGVEWSDLERAAYHALAGSSSAFRPMQLVSSQHTDNVKVRETPVGERWRVQVTLRNPLAIPIVLRRVRLALAGIEMREGEEGASPLDEVHEVSELAIPGGASSQVELWVRPSSAVAAMRADAVLFDLCTAEENGAGGHRVEGRLPLEVQGKRLMKTAKQIKSGARTADRRLEAAVASARWPLMEVAVEGGGKRDTPRTVFCGQYVKLHMTVENIGAEAVSGVCVSTDGVECVAVREVDESGGGGGRVPAHWQPAANSPRIAVHVLRGERVDRGGRRKMEVIVRASDAPGTHAVQLLVYYRGEGGACREWRYRMELATRPLLAPLARLVDPQRGMLCVQAGNRVQMSEAAMARVDVLGVSARLKRATGSTLPLSVRPVRNRAVQLDCEQTDQLCVTVEGGGGEGGWMWLQEQAETPHWPQVHGQRERSEVEVRVLWKASFVSNSGHVSSLCGESRVDGDPFKGARVPGVVMDKEEGDADKENGGEEGEGEEPCGVSVSCLPIAQTQHDFDKAPLCEIPVRFAVRNDDGRGREAEVELRFTPTVFQPVASTFQLPPADRQQWWLQRPVWRVKVAAGDEKQLVVKVRVACPSAFELFGQQLKAACRFPDDARVRPVHVPNALAVVLPA